MTYTRVERDVNDFVLSSCYKTRRISSIKLRLVPKSVAARQPDHDGCASTVFGVEDLLRN